MTARRRWGCHLSAMPLYRRSPILRATGRLAVPGVLVALALVPARFLQGGQGIDVEGAFVGDPVDIRWTGQGAAPYRVVVVMETGLCDVVAFDAGGTAVKRWSAQKATDRGRIQSAGRVKLLPRPGAEVLPPEHGGAGDVGPGADGDARPTARLVRRSRRGMVVRSACRSAAMGRAATVRDLGVGGLLRARVVFDLARGRAPIVWVVVVWHAGLGSGFLDSILRRGAARCLPLVAA